jgi:hypothetical protein
MVVSGHYLYAALSGGGGYSGGSLSVFNIQNPDAPILVRALSVSSVVSMQVNGDRLYLTTFFGFWGTSGRVEILDLSTPNDPVLVGQIDSNDGALYSMSALSGDTLLIADAARRLRVMRLAEQLSLSASLKYNLLQTSFLAAPGRRYQLQSSESLPAASWINEGEPVTASGNIIEMSPVAPDRRMRFYRALVLE